MIGMFEHFYPRIVLVMSLNFVRGQSCCRKSEFMPITGILNQPCVLSSLLRKTFPFFYKGNNVTLWQSAHTMFRCYKVELCKRQLTALNKNVHYFYN